MHAVLISLNVNSNKQFNQSPNHPSIPHSCEYVTVIQFYSSPLLSSPTFLENPLSPNTCKYTSLFFSPPSIARGTSVSIVANTLRCSSDPSLHSLSQPYARAR